jgi:gag-polypeptide of LTR copia-type
MDSQLNELLQVQQQNLSLLAALRQLAEQHGLTLTPTVNNNNNTATGDDHGENDGGSSSVKEEDGVDDDKKNTDDPMTRRNRTSVVTPSSTTSPNVMIGAPALMVPPLVMKSLPNPGGLYGDSSIPATLPTMPKLAGLTAAEYNTWKVKAQAYFQANGLAEVVTLAPIESLQQALLIDAGQRTPQTIRAMWTRLHLKAYGAIRAAVEEVVGTAFFDTIELEPKPDIYSAPVDSTHWISSYKHGNANYLWTKLSKKLQQFTPHDLARLVGDYMSLKYTIGTDPIKFRKKFDSTIRELTLAGLVLPDKLHMAMWYRALPNELDSLKQTLSANPKLTHDNIYDALVARYASTSKTTNKTTPKADDGTESAMGAFTDSNKNDDGRPPPGKQWWKYNKHNNNNNQSDRPWCNYHQSHGHRQDDCPTLKQMKETAKSQATGTNTEQFSGCFVELDDKGLANYLNILNPDPPSEEKAMSAVERKNAAPPIFVFDSGATTHVVNNRNCLSDIKKTTEVDMATAIKGQKSTIRERGSVRLNDNWTLKDVAYVPNASSNLISEGRLCDAQFAIYKDSDFLRVTVKNTNRTVLEGIRVNRLWVLPTTSGSTSTPLPTASSAPAATASTSSTTTATGAVGGSNSNNVSGIDKKTKGGKHGQRS